MDQKNISQISSVLQLPSFFKLSTLSVLFGSKCLPSSQLSLTQLFTSLQSFQKAEEAAGSVILCVVGNPVGVGALMACSEYGHGGDVGEECVHLQPARTQNLLSLPDCSHQKQALCLRYSSWKKGFNRWFHRGPFYFLFFFRKIEVLHFHSYINNSASSSKFFSSCKSQWNKDPSLRWNTGGFLSWVCSSPWCLLEHLSPNF